MNKIKYRKSDSSNQTKIDAAKWYPEEFMILIDLETREIEIEFTPPPLYYRLRYFELELFSVWNSENKNLKREVLGDKQESKLKYQIIDVQSMPDNATMVKSLFEKIPLGTYHITLYPSSYVNGECLCTIEYLQCSCLMNESIDFEMPDILNDAATWGKYQNVELLCHPTTQGPLSLLPISQQKLITKEDRHAHHYNYADIDTRLSGEMNATLYTVHSYRVVSTIIISDNKGWRDFNAFRIELHRLEQLSYNNTDTIGHTGNFTNFQSENYDNRVNRKNDSPSSPNQTSLPFSYFLIEENYSIIDFTKINKTDINVNNVNSNESITHTLSIINNVLTRANVRYRSYKHFFDPSALTSINGAASRHGEKIDEDDKKSYAGLSKLNRNQKGDSIISHSIVEKLNGQDIVHTFEDVIPGFYYIKITPIEPSNQSCFCKMSVSKNCIQCLPATSKTLDLPHYTNLPNILKNPFMPPGQQEIFPHQPLFITTSHVQRIAIFSTILLLILLLLTFIYARRLNRKDWARKRRCLDKLFKAFDSNYSYHAYDKSRSSKNYCKTNLEDPNNDLPLYLYPNFPTDINKATLKSLESSETDSNQWPKVLIVYYPDDKAYSQLIYAFCRFLSLYCKVKPVAICQNIKENEMWCIALGKWEWVQAQLNDCEKVLFVNSRGAFNHYQNRLCNGITKPLQNTDCILYDNKGLENNIIQTSDNNFTSKNTVDNNAVPDLELELCQALINSLLDAYYTEWDYPNNYDQDRCYKIFNQDRKTKNIQSLIKFKLYSCKFRQTSKVNVISSLTSGYLYELMDDIQELLCTIHDLNPKSLTDPKDNIQDHKFNMNYPSDGHKGKNNFKKNKINQNNDIYDGKKMQVGTSIWANNLYFSKIFGFDRNTWGFNCGIEGAQLFQRTCAKN